MLEPTNTLPGTSAPADRTNELWGELRPADEAPIAAQQVHDDEQRGSIAPIVIAGAILLSLALALLLARGNTEPGSLATQTPLSEGTQTVIGDTEEVAETDDETAVPVEEDEEADEEPDTEPEIVNPAGAFQEPSINLVDGMVRLEGGQPDQATSDRIAGEISAIVGAENVTNNYVVDTRAPSEGWLGMIETANSITYVEDSFRVTEESQRQLDLVVYVLDQNPEAILTITSHAASRGDAFVATEAAQADADRLVVFFSEQGIDPERLIAVSLGSGIPLDADNPELPVNKRTDLAVAIP